VSTSWTAVDVFLRPCPAVVVEAVESAFNFVGTLGTETDTLSKKADEPIRVTGYFDRPPDAASVEAAVIEHLSHVETGSDALLSVEVRRVEDTDWLAEWKKHWVPSRVGRFVIAAPWHEVAASAGEIVIRIEPNMAFGTGTHETTRLCLAAVEENYRPGESFLEVGTGTGILAIAAAKLGCSSVVACDVDEPSIRIARQNADANGVIDAIDLRLGTLDESYPQASLLCANLTWDVIEPLLPLLIDKTTSTLVLSGILLTQRAEFETAISQFRITNYRIDVLGEWISLVCDVKA
jgi:ribosomal protein L11 methyltransferase